MHYLINLLYICPYNSVSMNKILTLLFVSVAVLGFGQTNLNADVDKSTIHWTGRKITKSHNGSIKLQSGHLRVKDGVLYGGEFVIDMNSIVDFDVKDPEWNEKLVGHLKSDDFFSVDKHPTATIKSKKVFKVKGKENTFSVVADLTIKGITNEVTFPITLKQVGGKYIAETNFNIDRSKWDVRFGSNSFFENLGDKAIKNEIEFAIVIETL